MTIEEWRGGKWSKQDWIRFWLHFFIGLVCAWLVFDKMAHGIILSFAFLAYEAFEDWRINDLSFKDVLGFLWGFGVLSLLISILF
jgi:hypothetical protein